MLICWAIRSRTRAVGVGFFRNSASNVTSWSCVARCRFWFFCCWVSVLFRGGRLEAVAAWCGGEGDIEFEDILWSSWKFCNCCVMDCIRLCYVRSPKINTRRTRISLFCKYSFTDDNLYLTLIWYFYFWSLDPRFFGIVTVTWTVLYAQI